MAAVASETFMGHRWADALARDGKGKPWEMRMFRSREKGPRPLPAKLNRADDLFFLPVLFLVFDARPEPTFHLR